MKSLFRRAFGGGGNRSEARDIVREAAKQLGSEAAKVVDAKMPRGIDAWSVSGMEDVKTISKVWRGIPPYFTNIITISWILSLIAQNDVNCFCFELNVLSP